jgi:hypothetical protein
MNKNRPGSLPGPLKIIIDIHHNREWSKLKQKLSVPVSELLENICTNCPGTLWGEKSICRIHSKSIGEISSCEQWTRRDSIPNDSDGEQMAFLDLEPAMEIVQKTEEDLRDYHWLVKEIERLQEYLDNAIRSMGPGNRLIAQYGDEAGMPRGQGVKPSMAEERFERQWQRLEKLKEKVKKIDAAAEQIDDMQERAILECILDGERMNVVARHIGVSRQRLYEIRRIIVKKMAWVLYEDELKG